MTGEPIVPFVHREQLMFDALGPQVGERWRSRVTSTICAVIDVTQRRHCWVTVRIRGAEQTLRLDRFLANFERMQPYDRRLQQ